MLLFCVTLVARNHDSRRTVQSSIENGSNVMDRLRITIFLFVTIITSFIVLHAAPAPNFSLPTTDTTTVCLDSLKGKVVYLDFWASWCDPCRKSFPWMEQLQHKYAEKGLVVVAVCLDRDRDKANDFLEKHPVTFKIGFDTKNNVVPLYDVKAMPTSFIIGRSGEIVSSHAGFLEKEMDALEKRVEEELKK